MKITSKNIHTQFHRVREKSTWNAPKSKELKMHKIHLYPAKFPSLIISKSLEYAKRKRITVNAIGDVFCGCGTVALEAKRWNKQFWGCDINPVATLIARVKSENYDTSQLEELYYQVLFFYYVDEVATPEEVLCHDRLKYWFPHEQIINLYRLLHAIRTIEDSKYQEFFLVAFSNILKRTSRWLTKSIKPTIDKKKTIYDVLESFETQFKMMHKAVEEMNEKVTFSPTCEIVNTNLLDINGAVPFLDMLVSSPPYVTSYEYADLHQLSSIWLGFCNDFRELREGTIGSVFHQPIEDADVQRLNEVGQTIYANIVRVKANRPKSILKYFLDMDSSVQKAFSIVRPGGLAVFVIGNTTYKSAHVDNAKYLTQCMLNSGFEQIEVFKRKISEKMLTPYRDKRGKFSSDKRHRKVYSFEYVIMGRKPTVGHE